ncbi:MAG: type II secretion system protein [Syntrophaceae bacterium]|nr:type II secretion system protein [Syntrophaceae bacterium]
MYKVFRKETGFSLVEISIVLIIIGMILGAAVTLWRSSIGATKLSTTKSNLENIKNSVINFAIANGRLPCPDVTVPPVNTGTSEPNPATCVPNCICNTCVTPPCRVPLYVPFQTLQLQLPGGRDSFGNVFRYDNSYEAMGGGGLTNTTHDTFCGVLFEYLTHSADTGVQRVPCVTNTNDTADDGQISAALGVPQGYAVAAVIISQTPADSFFSAPLGLSGKNTAGTAREYEMANRANDRTYGNFVSELTFNELYSRVCTAQKTKIRIQNYTGASKYAQFAGTGVCTQISATGFVDIYQGSTATFFNDAMCTTPCGAAPTPITFTMALTSDAGTTDWNGTAPWGRDGKVRITGACNLSDNTSANP